MRKIFAVLALTGLVMSVPAFADDMKLPELKRQPTPQAVLDEHLDALNKCDWNRIMAQFPDDVEFMLPNGAWIKGRTAVGNMFVGFCKDHKDGGFRGATFLPEESASVGDTIGEQRQSPVTSLCDDVIASMQRQHVADALKAL
jgi:hypothetical protein